MKKPTPTFSNKGCIQIQTDYFKLLQLTMKLSPFLLAFPILFTTISNAASLPVAGTCKYDETAANSNSGTIVSWRDDRATVTKFGKNLHGFVVGLREHSQRFKLSIKYEDPIMGKSEVVIFERPFSDPPRHRMAFVHYDVLEGGERVVSSLDGFNDVICAIVY